MQSARGFDTKIMVVYTTVAYAFINNEKSLAIGGGLNSDLAALSAIARGPGPSDGRPGDADNKAWRRTGKVMKVMPDEIRSTVRLYLDGKIRQWYSRADGKGVVFFLGCKDVAEATSVMEALPLARERLVNVEFTSLAPLTPLRLLLDGQPGRP